MVVVEPREFFWEEHLPDDRRLVDRIEGERIKLEEFAEFRLLIGHDEQRVLDTDAKLSCEIDARLVCNGHPFHQGRRLPLHTELMGALVNIEISTHAMICAMQIVQALAPHCLTSKDIDLRTTTARGELTELYLDMPLQYQGIDFLHLVSQRAKGNGTSDIGSAVEILGTTIEQKEPAGSKGISVSGVGS